MMNLIDSQHGRRWIVDGGRKRFRGDINNDAKGVCWILFQSTFLAHRYGAAQGLSGNTFPAVKEPEQWITGGNEVSNLWHQFDEAVCTLRESYESHVIEREYDAVNFVDYDAARFSLQDLEGF